jgi:DNA helicase-2/ATP-dependent DNA helicase PcrA
LDNYHEGSAVYRILNLPVFEIAEQDIATITQYTRKKTISLFEALQESTLIPGLSAKTQEKIVLLLDLIKNHSQLAREKSVFEVFVAFLHDSGYLKYLTSEKPAFAQGYGEAREKLELLEQFGKKVKAFEDANIEPTLKNFMEEINLELESGEEGKLEFEPEKGPDMIKVMTIHGSKGLEFKYVFLANMVDRRFPTDQRKDPIELPETLIKDIKPTGDVHLQEERRLCYVAMTRAKKELYFTSAEDYGGQRKKKLSRFLAEMGYAGAEAKNSDGKSGVLAPASAKASARQGKTQPQYMPAHFSYSQLAAFEKCPLQYKFNFILKVPVRGKAVFSFGKTMHNTLYEFLKMVNEPAQADLFGNPPSLKASARQGLEKLYEKNWIDEWYESKKQKEEYLKLGKRIIKEFYDEFEKNPPKILKIGEALALEMPFNLKIGEHTLFGVIDRIDDGKDGVTIVDYKTGQSKDKLDADAKEQLLIYQIAAKEVLHLKPKQLAYHYLDDGKKAVFLGSDLDLENQKEKIIDEIEKIKNSEFTATPGWQCQYCDFKDICDFAQK